MSSDDYQPSCYDCDREMPRRYLQTRPVIIPYDEGLGYDEVPVPLCSRCEGKRFGFDCPNCGLQHDTMDDAQYCCERRPGDAPDCKECGRRMKRGAWGFGADGERSVEWAECEGCNLGWGRFTGWHDLDDAEDR